MITNLFKMVNKGKGIIFNPVDSSNHPIVGGCLSPRVPAIDCIETEGSTLPDWVTQAREEADYDDSYDKMSPPQVRDIDHAYGGYSLKLNGIVCSLKSTLGMFRSKGKTRMLQRNYTMTPVGLVNSPHYYPYGQTAVHSKCPMCGKNFAYGEAIFDKFYFYSGSSYYNDGYVDRETFESIDVPLSAYYAHLGPSDAGLDMAPNRLYVAYSTNGYYNITDENGVKRQAYKVHYTGSFVNMTMQHKYRTTYTDAYTKKHVAQLGVDHDTLDISDTVSRKDYIVTDDNILYIAPTLLTSGTKRATTGTQSAGVHTYTSDIVRDTTSGFMVGTNKGLVINQELRRNFLRISPTVFKHEGEF